MIFLKLIFLLHAFTLAGGFLTNPQFKDISSIVRNKNTPIPMRQKVNNILFKHYEKYSFYKALKFKNYHKMKCKHIGLSELVLYSNRGLLKAIKRYDGSNNFRAYLDIYIAGELYAGMTELHPISSVPKKIRIMKKNNKSLYSPEKTQYFSPDNLIFYNDQHSN